MRIQMLKSCASVAIPALIALAALPVAAMPVHNVPNGVAIAHDDGRVDPAKEMNLTVILKMHNQANFDQELENLVDPSSARYHQWFTGEDFERYAPTPQEYETVRSELVKQGFSVISQDARRLTIRVHGTAAVVEKAFHTELHTFTYKGRTFQAHTVDARVDGPAGDLIDTVAGLERHQSRPQLVAARDPRTGKPFEYPLTTKESLTQFKNTFTNTPLSASAAYSLNTFGGAPTAAYSGTGYAVNGKVGALTPAQLKAHYGVPFTQNSTTYDGTGQTIALVEGYGYPYMEADANIAAGLFGLPPKYNLAPSNFKVVYPEGKPLDYPDAAYLTGWDTEIALDIQSAHAIAPGAKIVVVASSGQDDEDQLTSLLYVINPTGKTNGKPLAYVASSSWENNSEIISGLLQEEAFDDVLKEGVAAGISFDFSSGDSGDLGLGMPVGDLQIPANSPHATAVGGTSILNDPYNSNATVVTGWGNDFVILGASVLVEDPLQGFFYGGAGGGESLFFPRPNWEQVSGAGRQVPDISALADPSTGFPIVVSTPTGPTSSQASGYVYGGTSLACPIFTAVWAIADEYNGAPLGQAGPLINKFKASASDVTAPSGTSALVENDVAGSITNAKGKKTNFNARQIFTKAIVEGTTNTPLSLYTQSTFVSAVWPVPINKTTDDYYVVSFGTDSSLTVGNGWDNVTGWGEPVGKGFVRGVTDKTTGAGKGEK